MKGPKALRQTRAICAREARLDAELRELNERANRAWNTIDALSGSVAHRDEHTTQVRAIRPAPRAGLTVQLARR